jgi:hypothetical protein
MTLVEKVSRSHLWYSEKDFGFRAREAGLEPTLHRIGL